MSFFPPQPTPPSAAHTMPNYDAGGGGGGGGSYFDGSFDYRSLLPSNRLTAAATTSTTTENYDDSENTTACSCLPSLTWRERYLGCAVCMIAGYLLSMGSFWRLGQLMTGHPLPFVFNATIGNLLALAGSCFLMGPTAQIHRMWQEQRRMATTAYIGSVGLTLIVAFWKGLFLQGLWLIILMMIQCCAITWYCLSYIPYAQDAVVGYCNRILQRTEY